MPAHLKNHGQEVLNPALPDDDFDAAVRIDQTEFDQRKPDVVVGSSRANPMITFNEKQLIERNEKFRQEKVQY